MISSDEYYVILGKRHVEVNGVLKILFIVKCEQVLTNIIKRIIEI
jgi:hypothetical protein